MAAQRKLQGEIDKTMKKIDEHIEEFETLWNKVQAAPTPALKDKYENDLKKEIKKLQRQRDQLKTWIAASEVKNKKPLIEGRRLIELQMERFKVLERETKTKAYSKEGLSRDAKRREGGDSGDDDNELSEEVLETMEWLDALRDELEEEQDKLTQHLDKLKQAASTSKKSKGNEEDLNSSQHVFDRHAWHIQQIDAIKDALETGVVEATDVNNIKDDMDYYVHNHKDEEFEEDEMIYDVLDLPAYVPESEHGESSASDTESAVDDEPAASADPIAKIISSSQPAKPHAAPARPPVSSAAPSATSKPQAIPAKQQPNAAQNNRSQVKASPPTALNPISSPARQAPTATKAASAATVQLQRRASPPTTNTTQPLAAASASAVTSANVPSTVPATAAPGKGESLASILAKQQQQQAPAAKPTIAAPQPAVATTPTAILQKPQPANGTQQQQQQSQQPAAAAQPKPTLPAQPQASPPATRPTPSVTIPSSAASTPAQLQTPLGNQRQASATPTHQQQQQQQPSATSDMFGLQQPLSNASPSADLPPEYMANLSLLQSSRQHLPDPSDTERAKVYIPRNPFSDTFRAPPSFPTTPSPIFEQSSLWEKFSADTLFFIFYFQQGTSHQYLAARELKRASWRYHKNFLTWFQRHDDVVVTTEEYEQGTYVYFDYESGWCQRIKHDFTFEYKHLEDDLTLPSV